MCLNIFVSEVTLGSYCFRILAGKQIVLLVEQVSCLLT